MKLAATLSLTVLTAFALASTGCRGMSKTEQYAAGGAATGGVIAGIIGHNIGGTAEGATLGAISGGLIGGAIGHNREAQERAHETIDELEKNPDNRTIYIRNSDGTRTAVIMRRNAQGKWIGPNGEVYSQLPSKDELQRIYGT